MWLHNCSDKRNSPTDLAHQSLLKVAPCTRSEEATGREASALHQLLHQVVQMKEGAGR